MDCRRLSCYKNGNIGTWWNDRALGVEKVEGRIAGIDAEIISGL